MTANEALKLINEAVGAEEVTTMVNKLLDQKKAGAKRSFNVKDGAMLIQELAEAIADEEDTDDEDDFGRFDDEDEDDEIYDDDEYGGEKGIR